MATTRHSKKITLAGIDCEYSQLKMDLFTGFELVNDTYLAHPEKAFLDQIYLVSLGKRSSSISDWDLSHLDKDKLAKYLTFYNNSVQKMVSKMEGILD